MEIRSEIAGARDRSFDLGSAEGGGGEGEGTDERPFSSERGRQSSVVISNAIRGQEEEMGGDGLIIFGTSSMGARGGVLSKK